VGEILELGREVESFLNTTVEAIENWDAGMARQRIGVDSRYRILEKSLAPKTLPIAR
jgi:hypothetical protein